MDYIMSPTNDSSIVTAGYCSVEPTTDDVDDLYIKKEDVSVIENNAEERRKFINAISPKYKADVVYKKMVEAGTAPEAGPEKRRLLRSLERAAGKGKLDKYFL